MTMEEVTKLRCTCDECGHTWTARGTEPPARCAKCYSKHWHKPPIIHPKRNPPVMPTLGGFRYYPQMGGKAGQN